MEPDVQGRATVRRHWAPVVGGVLFARLFINHPLIVQTFGALLVPLSVAMHTDRGHLSLALSLHLLFQGAVSPVYGVMLDRYGVRRVLIPCLVLSGALLACAAMASNLAALTALYVLLGLTSAAAAPTAWSKIVTMVVHRRRGLALSALSTTGGIGGAVMPMLAAVLIGAVGWRGTYVWLGVLMVLGTVPVLLAVVPRDAAPAARAGGFGGSSLVDILRRPQFWAMVAPACAIGVACAGLAVHYIPMLMDRGVSLQQATAFNALPNLMLVVTALVFGHFIDRTRPVLAGIALSWAAACGFLVLAFGAGWAIIPGAAVAGCAGGAEIGLIGYLCTRYFAPEDFGKTYGLAFFFWILSQSVGAAAFGFAYAATGDYVVPLAGSAIALLLAPLALTRLGPYLFHGRVHEPQGPVLSNEGRA
ncbi:MAG TPA: MFS transporter [Caulobacteraceae bacterium]|nr:MFS transporter [Caulobacteraceae bacterium]